VVLELRTVVQMAWVPVHILCVANRLARNVVGMPEVPAVAMYKVFELAGW
jgi:hypothetical protein